jgi:hypothetical protein
MKWRDIVSRGKTYPMQHLHPFTTPVQVGHRSIDLRVQFGFHVFTDEKGNGTLLRFHNEERYFCPTRYADSHQAVHFLQNQMATAHTRPYFAPHGNQQYFVMDIPQYPIFLAIQKPQGTTNVLNCRVISAYTLGTFGHHGLPTRNKLRSMGFVLDRKEQGQFIPMK